MAEFNAGDEVYVRVDRNLIQKATIKCDVPGNWLDVTMVIDGKQTDVTVDRATVFYLIEANTDEEEQP